MFETGSSSALGGSSPQGMCTTQVTEHNADNSLKTTQISDLQTHLGALIACYFNLKDKLAMEFGDKLKSFIRELGRADPAQASQQGPLLILPL